MAMLTHIWTRLPALGHLALDVILPPQCLACRLPVGQLGSRDTVGMSVYIREIARELGRLGHTVDIFTRAHDPADDQIVEIGPNARIIHLQVGEIERMHKLVLYAHLADMACAVEGFRKRHDLRYDVIHSHYWLSGRCGVRLKDALGLPLANSFHTLGKVKDAARHPNEAPSSNDRLVTEQEVISRSDCVIASTPYEFDDLLEHYGASPERLCVSPPGVDHDVFNPGDQGRARNRLGFGDDEVTGWFRDAGVAPAEEIGRAHV